MANKKIAAVVLTAAAAFALGGCADETMAAHHTVHRTVHHAGHKAHMRRHHKKAMHRKHRKGKMKKKSNSCSGNSCKG